MTDNMKTMIAEEAENRWPKRRDRLGPLGREMTALNAIQRAAFESGAQYALEAVGEVTA